MSQYILSAFADEYAASFEEQVAALSRFGIDFIEIRGVDGKNVSTLTDEEILRVKQTLESYGIRASAIGSPIGKIALDGDLEAHFAMARRVFAAAKLLGARYVRVFSFYAPTGREITDCRERVLDALEHLLDIADEYGVVLCHENEARIYGDVPERCRELARHFGGRLKCVFDMGNFVLEGVEPVAAYQMLQDHVAYFHIKDALYAGAIVPPGKGEACIAEILAGHKSYASEDFFVSLEPHLQTFDGLNALVGRGFENPYKYPDAKEAFADAVQKFREATT